ncbi:hypothetical protein E2C01_077673 [Portunus trituberculatus]|uniref:Uncharacterized protein n=1 Tax=Portunus trituberculatus TaxID=210409 RepID=A0A5B7IKW7_PORTR|nr:hypothetical protein [Portunus trituberculatus]
MVTPRLREERKPTHRHVASSASRECKRQRETRVWKYYQRCRDNEQRYLNRTVNEESRVHVTTHHHQKCSAYHQGMGLIQAASRAGLQYYWCAAGRLD